VTAEDVVELQNEIEAAESETRRRISTKSGKEYTAPSHQRSDVGAVESIELPSSSDKRKFALDDAIQWLSDPRTSGAYFVEFFAPPPTFLPGLAEEYLRHVVDNITQLAKQQNVGLEVFAVDIPHSINLKPSGVVAFRLVSPTADRAALRLRDEHARLLAILDVHPYVRKILLPPIITATKLHGSTLEKLNGINLPPRKAGIQYPRVGIIDGGIAGLLSPWTLGAHTIVAPEHLQVDHGTFIGGLLVSGSSLNVNGICNEPDGCDLFDVGILPDVDQSATFDAYYPKGVVDFLTELEHGVEIAKRDHGVRIFNLSLNLSEPVNDDSYGVVASLLDRIADKHEVLFVISAGNLRSSDCRPEWPSSATVAVQQLAARTLQDTLLQPAESSRCIAVGALNAPGCRGRVEGVPASYTRRGPGLRVGVKPDVAQVGGSMPDARTDSGVRSWIGAGDIVYGHGTSYAAPLVAKSLATLDSRVSSSLTREMLVALLIHGCEIPLGLRDPSLSEVARQFAGFGVPQCSESMLHTPDHAITLVFADMIHRNRELKFDFAWPTSLVNSSTGACKGEVRMTLVYRPMLNRDFGAEFVRMNVDAHLRQEENGKFVNRVQQAFLPESDTDARFEHELIRHGLKWWPIKAYKARFPHGKGNRSNWQLTVESLLRADEVFPAAGIPFALVLSIQDIGKSAPVFNDLRLHLSTRNVQISDIKSAPQIRVQP
jgi:hypothetical protein